MCALENMFHNSYFQYDTIFEKNYFLINAVPPEDTRLTRNNSREENRHRKTNPNNLIWNDIRI